MKEAEEMKERLNKMERENQALKQNLVEAKSIISQNIDRPLTADDRDTEIVALREKNNSLSQENVELQKKVRLIFFFQDNCFLFLIE